MLGGEYSRAVLVEILVRQLQLYLKILLPNKKLLFCYHLIFAGIMTKAPRQDSATHRRGGSR